MTTGGRWMRIAVLLLGTWPAVLAMGAEPGPVTDTNALPGVYRSVGLGAAAALTMTVCVLGASYAVGRIGTAAMAAAAEKPELLARSLLFVALAEGLAVLGFAIAIMMLQKI